MALWVLIRGGGDLASGVALRLFRAGLRVIITELPEPLVVRRAVSFAEAVYHRRAQVEEVTACLADDLDQAIEIVQQRNIPVLVDPRVETLMTLRKQSRASDLLVLIDGRMTKKNPDTTPQSADLVIGLGPGFIAGENCHAVVETNRGHHLGRVIWQGPAEKDTGVPENVIQYGEERVLRAPADGLVVTHAKIGDHLEKGQLVAEVAGMPVYAYFRGVLRGIIQPGIRVRHGLKIGDVDPRDDPRDCFLVSDKSLAIGGGVLEAILSSPKLRQHLWEEDATLRRT